LVCPYDFVPLRNIDQGQKPLQDWQVDSVGLLLRSLGKYYILTAVDTVTGLLFVSAVTHASQDMTIPGQSNLCQPMAVPRQYIVTGALILLNTRYKNAQEKGIQ
jgi:hypothetical protein